MINRRTFIQQTGIVTAAIMLNPSMSCGKTDQNTQRKIGIQLYSLRNEIGKDVAGVIARVAKAGYNEVEVYGYSNESQFWGMQPKKLKELLDTHELAAPSGHYLLDRYLAVNGTDDELKIAIDTATVLGHKYVTVPYLDEKLRKTADDYRRLAQKLNQAGELCKKADLQLAYHNHAFEFASLEGTSGLEIFLKETDAALLEFELDIYWVARAGRDAVALFNQYPQRFTLWHVKDMDKTQPELNTEVGKGSINYRDIFVAAKASGVKHIFVEQENFSIDPFESITESASYIRKNLLPVMS